MIALPISYAVLVCVGALVIVHQPRRPLVHCARCGYDLERNVLPVCPECGDTAPVRAAPLPAAPEMIPQQNAPGAIDGQRPAA
jgi:hypothetical protein